jgi:hypothetical protein
MGNLLKSRKFWLMIADLVFSIAIYFIGKYVGPEAGNDILWLIGMIQPVIISVITGIAIEDAAMKSSIKYLEDCDPVIPVK